MGARAGNRRRPLLAIIGHIDEIGLVVTHAGDDGGSRCASSAGSTRTYCSASASTC
jgi:putative aminopeptidase FrvX